MQRSKGFTLIELLIVISIISVLSVIGIVTYRGVQSKARDSTRKHDLNNLAIALEIYFQQNNGKYITATGGITSCPAPGSTTSAFYSSIASYMSDGIVSKDPKTPQALYCYISSNGSTYTLCATLENTSDPDKNSLCPTGYNFGVVPK